LLFLNIFLSLVFKGTPPRLQSSKGIKETRR
jgi:hypothetical protein